MLVIPNEVAHWKFDEGTGTSVSDSSGNSLTGTASGSPTWGTGRFGGCLNFDGTNDYVNVPDNALLDFGASQDFSISGWIKTSTAKAAGLYPVVLAKRMTSGSPILDYGWYMAAEGEAFSMYPEIRVNGTTYAINMTGTLNDGNWHHVVFQRQGTTIRAYRDNVVDAHTITDANISGSCANSFPLRFGQIDVSGFEYWFTGSLDDFRFYTRAITTTEIAALYNGTAA